MTATVAPGLEARRKALSEVSQDVRPLALAALDTGLKIVEANTELGGMTGVPAEALVGRHASGVFEPVWPRLEQACLDVLADADLVVPLQLSWPGRANRRPTLWIVRLGAIRGPDGEITGVAIAASDDSARRLLSDQLVRSQKLESLGRLSAGIAHDFNNLLTAIGGYTGLVRSDLPAGDPRREDLDEVLKAVDRARSLSLRLLSFTRGSSSQPVVTGVDSVMRDAERLLRRLVSDDVQLHMVLQSHSAVYLRTGELEQMLVNLVINASDAMPEGGEVTLETLDVESPPPGPKGLIGAPPGEYVRITVADTGSGMDAATQARIFESFFTTKAPDKGTGLGLSTVFSTVEQAGGDLTIQSDLHRGSRFELYLPLVRGPAASTAVARPMPTGTESVLIVEDQDQVLLAVVRMLRGLGYAVTGVDSPLEALDRCARPETRPDLLLTDVMMPVMSGPELARRCRTIAPGLAVLFMSGFSAGIDVAPLLVKPFDQRALGEQVREVLDGGSPS